MSVPVFSDLGGFDWAKPYIELSAAQGIINGIGDGLFAPRGEITVGDFCFLAVKAAGLVPFYGDAWDDHEDGYWIKAAGYVRGDRKIKIAPEGFSITRDYFGQPIMRQYAFNIMWHLIASHRFPHFENKVEEYNRLTPFNDRNKIEDNARESTFQLFANGIVTGINEVDKLPRLGAGEGLSRAQACVLIIKCLATFDEVMAREMSKKYVTTTKAFVRKTPSTVGEVAVTYDKGARVDIVIPRVTTFAEGRSWVKVPYGGLAYGWMPEKELKPAVSAGSGESGGDGDDLYIAIELVRVREEPNTDCAILGVLESGQLIRIASAETEEGDGYTWIRIYYGDGFGWVVAEAIELAPSWDDLNIGSTMRKLANDTTLPVGYMRRYSMVLMGQALIDAGFDLAFTAGMLGNIQREGSFGEFEGAGSQPYLQYFIANHDYLIRFHRKQIHRIDITLQELYNITYNSPNQANIFGLGIIQWTNRPRFFALIENYMDAVGGNGRITEAQVVEAETRLMIEELRSGEHTVGPNVPNGSILLDIWRERNVGNLDTENAVKDAAYLITAAYARPKNAEQKAIQRKEDAANIYRIITT